MAFFSRHEKRTHVVIDLGSQSIKTAIFERPLVGAVPLNVKKIVTRLPQVSRGSRAFAHLRESVMALIHTYDIAPEKMVIGIGSHVAETSLQEWTVDSFGSGGPRESLTAAHIKKYFQQLFDQHRDDSHAFLGYPVSIEVNGYPVDIHTIGSHDSSVIKEIALRTIMLRFSDEAGSAFSELKNAFSGIPIELVPVHALAWEVLAAICKIRNGILCDVGGSVTTLMFIHNGSLAALASFPLGTERFTHRIIKTRGGKFVEAQDLARQYTQGLMSKDEQVKLSHIFSQEKEEWKKACIKTLETFYPVAPLPQNIYLYGGGAYIPEVRAALWSHDLIKKFSPFESLNAHIIQASQIFNNDTLKGNIVGPEDVGLAALVYYSLYHTPLF